MTLRYRAGLIELRWLPSGCLPILAANFHPAIFGTTPAAVRRARRRPGRWVKA